LTAAASPPRLCDSLAPIRVAYVVHVMQVAGAEVLVAEMIHRLGPRLDPVVFCLDAVGPLGSELQSQGIPVLSFDRRPGKDWGVAWRMAREIRKRRVEVIHAHQYTPFFYSALARAVTGARSRLVFTEHGRHYPDVVGRNRRWLNRLVLARLANETNAVCGFSARALQAVDGFSAVPVGVVANGIDSDRYGRAHDPVAAKLQLGLSKERRYIATVARFHPVKDHRTLLEAYRGVAAAQHDVDLLLVGDGPLRDDLERQTERLELRGRVHFLGVRSDVAAILGVADVFALTSVSEAASLTLLEAMASGLPVVITDVGGNPEMVRHGVEGLLVQRGDAGSIANALLELLENPERARRLGSAGADRVRRMYQLDQAVERHYETYRRMVCR
jgi:L-malate glycosyltransferase